MIKPHLLPQEINKIIEFAVASMLISLCIPHVPSEFSLDKFLRMSIQACAVISTVYELIIYQLGKFLLIEKLKILT